MTTRSGDGRRLGRDGQTTSAMLGRESDVRSAGRTSVAVVGGRFVRPVGIFARNAARGLLIAALAGALVWLVWIYGDGLRDPRYLDGWVLAGGMGAQLYFHIARKRGSLSPRRALRWRRRHILLGYFLIAAFILHSDFSLPDTAFEWVLWMGFVLVAASGAFGTYLAWWLQARRGLDDGLVYDRILIRRAELASELQAMLAATDQPPDGTDLPSPPYQAWIADLYAVHLREFFGDTRNTLAHLVGSEHHLERLMREIDDLSGYVDQSSQARLAAIKALVLEKDRLDFARVYLGLSRAWLLVHVPVTYGLIVLAVVHVVVVYAFSAGLH